MKRLLTWTLEMLLLLAGVAQAADVTGTWQLDVQLDQGSGTPTIVLRQEGAKLSGKYSGQFGEAPVTGTVDGEAIRFEFTVDAGGTTLKARYQGRIESADSMRGTCEYGELASGKWTAKRK